MTFINKALRPTIILCCSLGICLQVYAQQNVQLASPNGSIAFSCRISNHVLTYDVTFKKQLLIANSELSLSFLENGNFNKGVVILFPTFHDGEDNYELVVGKNKKVHEYFKEVSIPLKEKLAPERKINLVVRAYNDGLAFRYEFPEQKNWTSFSLTDENTSFNIVGNPTLLTMFLPNYLSSHEGLYHSLSLTNVVNDTLIEMPTLFEFSNKTYLALTEAALLDYAGMYLQKHNNILRGVLSPLPHQTNIKVKAKLPHKSPWRVMMISDRIGALIESNILTNLNEPNKIKDVSWIKPGKTTFPWWNGNVLPDSINAPGNNFVTAQYYIDFCARNNIAYHSVVEYGLHQWYMDDGIGFQPGTHSDVTTPVPGLDMKQICDYAHSKGVGVRVWVHWAALYPKLDKAFAIFEQWGLSGMMVDFMDRDDQEMVNIQTEILEKAAQHHLHIQFHGAYKPTGLSRTYPNEFTREGTLNYEVNKWGKTIDANHDINIPFTRMLAGSTDYHLGGFRAVPDSLFKVQYTRPLMRGTRCHMLAMYVVLENYLSMVCDYPAAYEGQEGFEFLQEVPTVWEATKVLDAKIGEYIAIARQKNNVWYVGVMTNNDARTIEIPMSFLSKGNYLATLYTDATDAAINPNHLMKEGKIINDLTTLKLKLSKGGGAVLKISKTDTGK